MLKTKYCKSMNVLHVATAPPDSSWVWKGIYRCMEFFKKWTYKEVGMDSIIHIWSDPWIPGLDNFKPIALGPRDPRINFVVDLFLENSFAWNFETLSNCFSSLSVRNILRIKPNLMSPSKGFIWYPDPKKGFSVKSAYNAIFKERGPCIGFESFSWKKLWKLKVHERLKGFIWKVAWGVIPTRGELNKRFRVENASCPLCEGPIETIEHLMLSCPLAKKAWRSAKWPLMIEKFEGMSIRKWLELVMNPSVEIGIAPKEALEFTIFAVILMDQIWKVRNGVVHKDSIPPFDKWMESVKALTSDHVSIYNNDVYRPSDISPLL